MWRFIILLQLCEALDSVGLGMLLFWLEVFVYHVQVRRPFWWITSSIYTEIDGKVWQLEVYAVCNCNTTLSFEHVKQQFDCRRCEKSVPI